MDLAAYQTQAATTAIYYGRGEFSGLAYCALGLAGEAGATANHVKKVLRDDNTSRTAERKAAVRDKLGDALWYLAQTCTELGIELEDIARENLEKLAERYETGRIRGDHHVPSP